ncbi:MAG TPA: fatty acid desaturase [Bryobacteraceae bacterium]
MLALAGIHGLVLLAWPTFPVIAIGVWWNSNTVAHNFIHRRFFRARWANLLFSAYLSVLLGIPQTLWRERHLAHHAGVPFRWRGSPQLAAETALILALWTSLAVFHPHFFLTVYLPAYLLGLALCSLQGHYEHARGVISHYGAIYNALCLNDGYHAEHHADPSAHWTTLPQRIDPAARVSRWPAPLRWLDCGLEALERLVLRSPQLQRFVLRSHRRAFQALLPEVPCAARVAIVGGGLFPRTALLLQELLPAAKLTIIDADEANLATATDFVEGVEFIHMRYVPGALPGYDLVVIPLSFDGNRAELERHPPASAVLIHDWIWRRRGVSSIVSFALLKRLNLILT